MRLPAQPCLRSILSSSRLPPLTSQVSLYLKSGLGTHPNISHRVLKRFIIEIHTSVPTELCDQTMIYAVNKSKKVENVALVVTTPLLFKLIPAVINLGLLLRCFSPDS
ncbi:hypothetical protein LWI28_025568 [Acer negundo]|uniref:Uncharacterized protein n=1 Tax=Acer negundo TaxID=4023 RepID=A0AAD5IRI0_ACENE|nr:hypothetical protein LWI28_025568 [Acer negundo]